MRIEEKNINKEDLNYKQGYNHLFNGISDIIKLQIKITRAMLLLQKQSEEICIGDQSENSKIDSEQVLEMLADIIKRNMDE